MRKGIVELDIDHKLEVIRQIHREREEYEKYGYQEYGVWETGKKDTRQEPGQKSWLTGFCIRTVAAMLLFLCLFWMEKTERDLWGMDYAEIVEYLGTDFEG